MTGTERHLRAIIANLESTLTWQAAQLRLLQYQSAGRQAMLLQLEAQLRDHERRIRALEMTPATIDFSPN